MQKEEQIVTAIGFEQGLNEEASRGYAMIICDKPLEALIERFIKEHGERQKSVGPLAAVAYLIGSRVVENEDFHVAHIARCSLPDTACDTEGDMHSRTVDAEWISDHGARLIRLLPGGADVIGFLWLADKKLAIDPRPMLIEAMQSIAKTSAALTTLSMEKPAGNMALITVDFPLGRPTGAVFDIARRGLLSGSPTKVSFNQLEWLALQSSAKFDFAIALADSKPLDNFHKQFTASLKDWAIKLFASELALIDGRFRGQNELLLTKFSKDSSSGGKRRGAGGNAAGSGKPAIAIRLLLPADVKCETAAVEFHPQCALTIKVQRLNVEAAVTTKASVGDAIRAVKHHIIRSLTSRAELHYESTEVVEDESKDRVSVHQLPRKATAHLPSQPAIAFSDFLFEADSAEDARETFKELLDIDLPANSIETKSERPLADGDLGTIKLCSMNETVSTELQKAMLGAHRPPRKFHPSYVIGAVSSLVAIFAIAVYFLWTGKS